MASNAVNFFSLVEKSIQQNLVENNDSFPMMQLRPPN